MSLPIVAALLWLVAANVIGMFPSPKRHHWPSAYVLIAVGLPLLAWLLAEEGAIAAAIFLIAGSSILRWPVRYLFRWIRRIFGMGEATG